jgi:hypothetical protein
MGNVFRLAWLKLGSWEVGLMDPPVLILLEPFREPIKSINNIERDVLEIATSAPYLQHALD